MLLKQTKQNKLIAAFAPTFYIIYRIEASTIAARMISDEREVRRDSSTFKLVNAIVQNNEEKYPEQRDRLP